MVFTKLKSSFFTFTTLSSLILFSAACGGSKKNVQIPGIDGPVLNLLEDNLIISVAFENITQIDGGIRYNIPKYPNSFIEVGPDLQTDGLLMNINIALEDILYQHVDELDPMTLPGGRPLPGVSGGALPAVAFSIPQFHNVAFYLGRKVFGVFVPIPKLPLEGQVITYRFYSGEARAGNISLVGQDQDGENGGFLLLLDLSNTVRSRMQRLVARYN